MTQPVIMQGYLRQKKAPLGKGAKKNIYTTMIANFRRKTMSYAIEILYKIKDEINKDIKSLEDDLAIADGKLEDIDLMIEIYEEWEETNYVNQNQ